MKILKIFTQPLCSACPPAKELGERLKQSLKIEYFDVSTPDGLAEARLYNIMSTPTLVLVEDNKEIKTWVGTPEEEEVKKWL
ncbi:MAG: thioredoxin family protein [bacterium]